LKKLQDKNLVLIFASDPFSIFNFRRDLIDRLIEKKFIVHLLAPSINETKVLVEFCKERDIDFTEYRMERYSLNPFSELKLLINLYKIIKTINPKILLSYTLKPNFYGLIVSTVLNIPHRITLITGLGEMFRSNSKSVLKSIFKFFYSWFLKKSDCIFFQNHDDRDKFLELKIISTNQNIKILPGSGVNLNFFNQRSLPSLDQTSFLMISRFLKDKGIIQYFEAAKEIKNNFQDVQFSLLGWEEKSSNSISKDLLDKIKTSNVINVLKRVEDVRAIIESCHVLVHPSFHEGMPRSVLEAMAIGRGIITTNAPGCRESIIDNYNGYMVDAGDSVQLYEAMKKFLIDPSLISKMSIKSRKLVEKKFDVIKVNNMLINEIIRLTNEKAV